MDVLIKLELPPDLQRFKLPPGVDERLQSLLDRQDRGETLTASERKEAEGLVDLAEMLSLLSLRAQRAERETTIDQ
jgi:ribosome assembly protein YihI (activator of Der GTPase)